MLWKIIQQLTLIPSLDCCTQGYSYLRMSSYIDIPELMHIAMYSLFLPHTVKT